MISITVAQCFILIAFFASTSVSLIIYIYNLTAKKINKIENLQANCPINKLYTTLGQLQNDINWIKDSIKNK